MKILKVLVIDDAEIARNILKRHLTKAGHEIIGEAVDGEAGVFEYKRLKPDLVTMDISMPNMDGIECLKSIIEVDGAANVIICSALDQKAMIILALKFGAKGYITKPIDEQRLNTAIKKIERKIKV